MPSRSSSSLLTASRVLRWVGLGAAVPALWACTSRPLEKPVVTPTRTVTTNVIQKINNEIDILFMIDNSSSMTVMQQKILVQLPLFMQVLQALPMGLPSVHVAVVSSDMGAPSDQGDGIGCSQTGGDNGMFYFAPEGTCTATTLAPGATFITDDAVGTAKNFSAADPMGIGTVFQCIALLGEGGCGFEHQLAAIDRALGADGLGPAPATNMGFLRPEAYLGIVMLTNEDDCSAPASATPLPVYSLNDGMQSIGNPDGPLGNYRCNGGPLGAHLCHDPTGPNPTAFEQPPLVPPPDAQGTAAAPTLTLTDCQDNETGSSALTEVSKFVSDIKALKADWANQILVGGIIAPPTPYAVEWEPGTGGGATGGELWPQVEHSCGPAEQATNPMGQIVADGSFGDPGVREAQFINAFGTNGVVASICDSSYAKSMTTIAMKLVQLIKPKCIAGTIQQDESGQPDCTVTNRVINGGVTQNIVVPACAAQPGAAPCWTLSPPDATNNCPAGAQGLTVSTDPNNPNPDSLNSLVECATCVAGVSAAGCPCLGNGTDAAGCL
ncbi:MAG TPA: vWA domain-containing protein [Polyangia bacterium]|nr:vWA domain-containing protein [Polyangia bacterium]